MSVREYFGAGISKPPVASTSNFGSATFEYFGNTPSLTQMEKVMMTRLTRPIALLLSFFVAFVFAEQRARTQTATDTSDTAKPVFVLVHGTLFLWAGQWNPLVRILENAPGAGSTG